MGANHPDTLQTRHNLAYQLGELDRHEEAVSTFAAVLEDRIYVLGADHPNTLRTRHNLAFHLGELGRYDESVDAFAAVLDDRVRVLGAAHPDTLRTRHGLAQQLAQLGRYDESVAAYAAVIEVRTSVLGADHAQTLATRHSLAYELGRAGRYDDAVGIAAVAFDIASSIRGNGDEMTERAIDILVNLVVEILRAGRPLPPAEQFGSFASTGAFALLLDLEAALGGSAEARARLPTELRSLVDGLTADGVAGGRRKAETDRDTPPARWHSRRPGA